MRHYILILFYLFLWTNIGTIAEPTSSKQDSKKEAAHYFKNKKELAQYKESKNAPYGWRPLHYAAMSGYLSVVKYLVTIEKMDINDTNDFDDSDSDFKLFDSFSPLHYGVWGDRIAVVNYLIAAGATVDIRDNINRTPLHYAAFLGSKKLCEILLKAGAQKDAQDDEGKSPLDLANEMNHQAVMTYLQ